MFCNMQLIDINDPEEIQNTEFLITFPKSGTNLTITSLQLFTKKPVRRPEQPMRDDLLGLNRLHLDLDPSKKILYRRHVIDPYFYKIDPTKNKLLMVLRNYKECINSLQHYSPEEFLEAILNEKSIKKKATFSHYINNLSFFENWSDDSTKLLIYYEDFILDPKTTIIQLLDFFDETVENFDEIWENYEC